MSIFDTKLVISPVDLLDRERMVLGWLKANPGAFMTKDTNREAVWSLQRFGLVDSKYVAPDYSKPYGEEGPSGYAYSLTEKGAEIADWLASRRAVCCEAAVRVDCVCVEKRRCLKHGEQCVGSHD